jgi:membrane protease YdiL (CAAX protease family)
MANQEAMMTDVEWEKKDIFGYRPKKQWPKPGLLAFQVILPLAVNFIIQFMAQIFSSIVYYAMNPDILAQFMNPSNTTNMQANTKAIETGFMNSPIFYVGMIVAYILMIGTYLLIVRFAEKSNSGTIGLAFGTVQDRKKAAFSYLRGLAVGFAMMLAVFLLLVLSGQSSVVHIGFEMTLIPVFIANTLMWIPQGASEEVMTRGYMMSRLSPKFGRVAAVTFSSLFFSCMHLSNNGINVVAIINLVLVAVFFALLALRTNELWTVCALHTVWNFAQGNLFGFEVSGNLPAASLLSTKTSNGSMELLTGGAFGPEGGLFVTLVVAVSLVVLLVVTGKKKTEINQN